MAVADASSALVGVTPNPYNGFTGSERARAYRWLKREYAEGRRKRPAVCELCGQKKGVIEPHSEDYSAPYGEHTGQYGLCYRCHIMLHSRFRAPVVWTRYVSMIRQGFRWPPLYGRDFGAVQRLLAEQEKEWRLARRLGPARRPRLLRELRNQRREDR